MTWSHPFGGYRAAEYFCWVFARALAIIETSGVDFGFNVRLGEFENSKPYGK